MAEHLKLPKEQKHSHLSPLCVLTGLQPLQAKGQRADRRPGVSLCVNLCCCPVSAEEGQTGAAGAGAGQSQTGSRAAAGAEGSAAADERGPGTVENGVCETVCVLWFIMLSLPVRLVRI